jgi:hypothetical protein
MRSLVAVLVLCGTPVWAADGGVDSSAASTPLVAPKFVAGDTLMVRYDVTIGTETTLLVGGKTMPQPPREAPSAITILQTLAITDVGDVTTIKTIGAFLSDKPEPADATVLTIQCKADGSVKASSPPLGQAKPEEKDIPSHACDLLTRLRTANVVLNGASAAQSLPAGAEKALFPVDYQSPSGKWSVVQKPQQDPTDFVFTLAVDKASDPVSSWAGAIQADQTALNLDVTMTGKSTKTIESPSKPPEAIVSKTNWTISSKRSVVVEHQPATREAGK